MLEGTLFSGSSSLYFVSCKLRPSFLNMSSRTATLAGNITKGVEELNTYLTNNGLPHSSFYVDAPVDLQLSTEAQTSATNVLSAALELYDLIRSPE